MREWGVLPWAHPLGLAATDASTASSARLATRPDESERPGHTVLAAEVAPSAGPPPSDRSTVMNPGCARSWPLATRCPCGTPHDAPTAGSFALGLGIIWAGIRDTIFGKGSRRSRAIESLTGLVTPSPQAYTTRIALLPLHLQIDGLSGALFNRK